MRMLTPATIGRDPSAVEARSHGPVLPFPVPCDSKSRTRTPAARSPSLCTAVSHHTWGLAVPMNNLRRGRPVSVSDPSTLGESYL
ncbi:hypothetical protein N658DRAFT_337137 [Parathielavia hyrcaniae]|uniref:Uncharacterized protein n=1 Tax=Parathielavia hyrcaniae TaxID=113614 RepID=A0AAN6T384_9PEZI|nr:hypothetical protein N658DRAFT_337137 [Parathielavia hyrcaniae]